MRVHTERRRTHGPHARTTGRTSRARVGVNPSRRARGATGTAARPELSRVTPTSPLRAPLVYLPLITLSPHRLLSGPLSRHSRRTATFHPFVHDGTSPCDR